MQKNTVFGHEGSFDLDLEDMDEYFNLSPDTGNGMTPGKYD